MSFSKKQKKIATHLPIYLVLAWLLPKTVSILFLCGIVDFLRNRPITLHLAYQYFFSIGTLTWLLSPINLFMDLITLKWRTHYQPQDFPTECQNEINALLSSVDKNQLITALEKNMDDKERGMIFFKWYGENIQNDIEVPAFEKEFRYIKTIGISAFNRNCSTSRHFGPLRITLRLLYNLQPVKSDGVYIEVANHKHYWHNNPLFIFDDTRIHQSFNEYDAIRYCMFVDVLRPSPLNALSNAMLQVVNYFAQKNKFIFYKKWKNIGKKTT